MSRWAVPKADGLRIRILDVKMGRPKCGVSLADCVILLRMLYIGSNSVGEGKASRVCRFCESARVCMPLHRRGVLPRPVASASAGSFSLACTAPYLQGGYFVLGVWEDRTRMFGSEGPCLRMGMKGVHIGDGSLHGSIRGHTGNLANASYGRVWGPPWAPSDATSAATG